jgi:hypothetical protein
LPQQQFLRREDSNMSTSKKAKYEAVRSLEHNGAVRPDDLVEAARDPDHACHNDFTWDVEEAARERWHDQARAIIRSFSFTVEIKDVGTASVSYYVPDPSSKDADDDAPQRDSMFRSVTSIRTKNDSRALFQAEVKQLLGIASRVYGIAVAKQRLLEDDTVDTLQKVRDLVRGLLDE